MGSGSDTPDLILKDLILKEFLSDVLEAFDRAIAAREQWQEREQMKDKSSCCEAPGEPGQITVEPLFCDACGHRITDEDDAVRGDTTLTKTGDFTVHKTCYPNSRFFAELIKK